MRDNLRGALLMTASMAVFAVEDALIKMTATLIPTGQVLMLMGLGGFCAFWGLLRLRGGRLLTPALLSRAVIVRNTGELVGTLGYVSAMTLGDLATASAILQATPLAVVLGAATFLKETVGWRRWSAVAAGFVGVLIVIRPWTSAFDPISLLALVGVAGLAVRDLATRNIPADVPSFQLSAVAYAAVVPGGFLLLLLTGNVPVSPAPIAWLGVAGTLVIGMIAYTMIVAATRTGEVSVIAPFRYSRIAFALLIATLVFGERPDAATLLGAALIVGSGLYAFWREIRAGQKARASLPPQGTI
ncbi:DMT family transporter [Roseisalinus antarcticus]|uniref:EamA-like transporter family protein n=1 Tax=Roseisalinus antarcticus TaxID=254357 RepID=A0A1Y5TBC2_9RHOB|nr:DMT family transporter [Roseisalinus antarcticus]SLN59893.1 EamA-like transporter family protein [Roseisalinus antarcticus]